MTKMNLETGLVLSRTSVRYNECLEELFFKLLLKIYTDVMVVGKNEIESAFEIAKRDLRSNYGKAGIYAGPRNHHEYWARDSLFASYGALALKDCDVVKKNLDLFVKHQNKIGHIPLRVEERFHPLALFGINVYHKKPRAVFKPSQPWAQEVIDSNPLFLISLSEYIDQTKDTNWMQENKQTIMNAVSWLVGKFDENHLVYEGINANWADFTFKKGNVLYTNILVWKAFNLLCKVLTADGAQYCLSLAGTMGKAINDLLWDEKLGYFIDRIDKDKRYTAFSSDGNLMAIFLDYATKQQGKKIFKFIDKYELNKVPVPIYYPRITGKGYILNKLFFTNYNTQYTFLWWGAISAVCRIKIGDNEGALKDLRALAEIINRHGMTPEIVDKKGNLINGFLYKTEHSAAWSAGLFVYAYLYAHRSGLV